jgi:hypothetical protein
LSQRAVNWVFGHTKGDGALRLLLLTLAHHSDEEGNGAMRRGKIASRSHLPEEHIEAGLQKLCQAGVLELPGNGRRTIRYRVLVPHEYGYRYR